MHHATKDLSIGVFPGSIKFQNSELDDSTLLTGRISSAFSGDSESKKFTEPLEDGVNRLENLSTEDISSMKPSLIFTSRLTL